MSDAERKFEDLSGKAKEAAGKVTGDDDLEQEGKVDQAKAKAAEVAEDAKESVKEKANEAADRIKDTFNR
ncbi:CsbD family protein [Lipingzhangella sp. LS1_29]|uniref:CsbD family protein n=1 Tax=Lipingzhangella rawalii TaxID=2055835 RepID=A0ABU2H9H3_9ACTN|nr:CsbD family protein [Lipingzhangella rawalii]MDS1271962.1 CsbD family protein [Lipingzhangella rawalii]